jgi:hypothetical protein
MVQCCASQPQLPPTPRRCCCSHARPVSPLGGPEPAGPTQAPRQPQDTAPRGCDIPKSARLHRTADQQVVTTYGAVRAGRAHAKNTASGRPAGRRPEQLPAACPLHSVLTTRPMGWVQAHASDAGHTPPAGAAPAGGTPSPRLPHPHEGRHARPAYAAPAGGTTSSENISAASGVPSMMESRARMRRCRGRVGSGSGGVGGAAWRGGAGCGWAERDARFWRPLGGLVCAGQRRLATHGVPPERHSTSHASLGGHQLAPLLAPKRA